MIADVVTLAAFASGAFKLLEVYYLGWAFYCAVALPILTAFFLFLLWMSTTKSCMYPCREAIFFSLYLFKIIQGILISRSIDRKSTLFYNGIVKLYRSLFKSFFRNHSTNLSSNRGLAPVV